jgi:hypothetical protein
MQHNHISTDTSMGVFSSVLSLIATISGWILEIFPHPKEIIPALITAFCVSAVAYFAPKLWRSLDKFVTKLIKKY